MHDAQRAGQPIVLQVKVKRLQLRRGQHALVDEGLTGKAWEVDGFAPGPVLTRALGAELVLGALAHHVGTPLQIHSGGACEEHLPEGGHRVAGQCAERRVVGRHLAPAQHVQALGLGDLLDGLARRGGVLRRLRQERDAGGVAARIGQVEFHHGAQKLVGDLQQDARAVAGVRFSALGTAVFQVQQSSDRLVDDVAAAAAVDVGDHGNATRVMLERGVVQPLATGRHSHLALQRTLRISWQPSTTASTCGDGAFVQH